MEHFQQASTRQIPLSQAKKYIAVEIAADFCLPSHYAALGLRHMISSMDEQTYANWVKAAHLLQWQNSVHYCSFCAAELHPHPSETALACPQCKRIYYPPIAPCIIVLIHRIRAGEKEILLARSPHFAPAMYSTIAGFMEPGESAEQTIIREIAEEVGVTVKNLHYFKSQPWPFPNQLMLGFFAEYNSGEIHIDNREICDADWFSKATLPQIPVTGTIAGQLIRTFLEIKD